MNWGRVKDFLGRTTLPKPHVRKHEKKGSRVKGGHLKSGKGL